MTKIRNYIEAVTDEMLNKVSWPTWSELQNSAVVVMVASALIAIAIWIMDSVFGINPEGSLWKGFLGLYYDMVVPTVGQ